MGAVLRNISGLIFNNLLVLDEYIVYTTGKNNEKRYKWKCKCLLCNKEVFRLNSALIKGDYKDCGCQSNIFNEDNFQDTCEKLIGQKFGWLEVVGIEKIKKENKIVCRCTKCNESIVKKSLVYLKKSKDIKCINCHYNINNNNEYIVPQHYINSIIRGAKSRNIEYNVSREHLDDVIKRQNFKCVYTGLDISFTDSSHKNRSNKSASLDRIDSEKGYIEGNIQWVHKDINIMKWDLSNLEFLSYIELIYKNKIQKENNK